MKKIVSPLLIFLFFLLSCTKGQKESSLCDFVDPMIGTGFHGHTFPGAVLPHGRVQLSPDTHIMGWEASSGYHYDDTTLSGFSHTHLSGTGIGDMGDVLFLPITGEIPKANPVARLDHTNEEASPGYYSIEVLPYKVKAELTASLRKGWHRYTFPVGKDAKIMINLAHVLQPNWGHTLVSGEIRQIDEFTVEGFRFTTGWAKDDPIWFRARFEQPIKQIDIRVDGIFQEDIRVGKGESVSAFLYFGEETEIVAQVGISSVDKKGAQINLSEDSAISSFDEVVASAKEVWEKELGSIEIQSKDPNVLRNFYTALYHSKIAPMTFSDADGRFRGIDRKIYQNKSQTSYTVYSLWDVFRSWYPLMTLIEPQRARTWAYDLYDHSEKGGLLPKWALNGNYTGTMVGYPATAILADAFSKGMIDSIPDKIIDAAVKSSSWQPDFNKKHAGTRAERVMPKQIYFKEKFGFVPTDSSNGSVSYGLEMAYYDWCVGRMAELAGNSDVSKKYYKKGKAYQYYFDKELGFMRGLYSDGTRAENFNPKYSDHEKSDFIEGNSWQWTPLVLHDLQGFRELIGGEEALGVWLDSLFTTSSEVVGENASGDITGLIGQYAHGNEPSHHVPFIYQYSDRPWKTQEVLDSILYHFYLPTPAGIIGNEDCGQMSAWYVLNAIGIYQVTPGEPRFTIGRPIVDEAKIKLSGGEFSIKVHNNAASNKYVAKALLNGENLDSFSFAYTDIKPGAALDIYMSKSISE